DRDAAEELAQEVGLAVLDAAGRGVRPDAFAPWLRAVARHRAADWYRRRARALLAAAVVAACALLFLVWWIRPRPTRLQDGAATLDAPSDRARHIDAAGVDVELQPGGRCRVRV